jgi:RNA exonuclease 4|tara:strand:- start:4211 stop:4906 length:696 start_codon:yes stop_codon:yes gene_type:complete
MAQSPNNNPYVATHFSIDVECVATGVEHNARTVAQIALVDQFERCLLNVFVKPPEGVTVHSYLTPLTGLSKEIIDTHGVTLEQAIAQLKATLPKHAVLVGQNIAKDVQWLNLTEFTDFAGMVDLAGLWRVFNKQYNSWSVFGQDHLVKTLLGVEVASQHDAASDALKSVRLFNFYQWLNSPQGGGEPALDLAKQRLLQTPPEPSFAKKNPTFEGCCMGNRKTCTCGAPFFG